MTPRTRQRAEDRLCARPLPRPSQITEARRPPDRNGAELLIGPSMNSVIRMHQARHRSLTQPLLDLKRLYWNCRTFDNGKRPPRSPSQHLGLKLPSYDLWDLLQRSPDDLKLPEEVSTSELAA